MEASAGRQKKRHRSASLERASKPVPEPESDADIEKGDDARLKREKKERTRKSVFDSQTFLALFAPHAYAPNRHLFLPRIRVILCSRTVYLPIAVALGPPGFLGCSHARHVPGKDNEKLHASDLSSNIPVPRFAFNLLAIAILLGFNFGFSRMHLSKLSPEDQATLDALYENLRTASQHMLGYQVAKDFDYSPLFRFLKWPKNNVGDPFTVRFLLVLGCKSEICGD